MEQSVEVHLPGVWMRGPDACLVIECRDFICLLVFHEAGSRLEYASAHIALASDARDYGKIRGNPTKAGAIDAAW